MLTVDGKGVVMRPEDLREATQRAAAARAKTFTARLGRGRRLHAKRMASVAAIYTIEPFVRTPEEILPQSPTAAGTEPARPRPEHKRVWASLAHSPENALYILTRSSRVALRRVVAFDLFLLRITERDVSDAISLSVALKRPERSFGGITDSRASSFTDGSARV